MTVQVLHNLTIRILQPMGDKKRADLRHNHKRMAKKAGKAKEEPYERTPIAPRISLKPIPGLGHSKVLGRWVPNSQCIFE